MKYLNTLYVPLFLKVNTHARGSGKCVGNLMMLILILSFECITTKLFVRREAASGTFEVPGSSGVKRRVVMAKGSEDSN